MRGQMVVGHGPECATGLGTLKENCEADRDPKRKAIGDQEVEGANQRQSREQYHCSLGIIEYAGCLEDQHEAERDQRIEYAGHQSADKDLEKLTQCDHGRTSMRDAKI